MSFTKKLVKQIESSKRQNVYLVHGEDKDLECWHYVLVENIKLPILQAQIKALPCDIDVASYGRVIKSGWGEKPSAEIKSKIDSGDFEFEEAGDGYEIFYVNTKDNAGEKFYAFIAVPEPLAEKFNYLMNKESSNINLYKWGEVLKWDWGEANEEDWKQFEDEFSQIKKRKLFAE